MYQNILVPVDGSAISDLGVQEATKLARLTGASVRLLHVVEQAAHLTVDAVLHEDTSGRVAEIVADEATSWGADLVVLGTHGRRGVGRLILGSDAEQVLRPSPVPVLLVRDKTPARG